MSVLRGSQRLLLSELRSRGGMTVADVATLLQIESKHAHARLRRLQARGVVMPTGRPHRWNVSVEATE